MFDVCSASEREPARTTRGCTSTTLTAGRHVTAAGGEQATDAVHHSYSPREDHAENKGDQVSSIVVNIKKTIQFLRRCNYREK